MTPRSSRGVPRSLRGCPMDKKAVAFGEIMLRLQPDGYLRVMQAEHFNASYTGAEANVCVSLSRFGIPTEFVTKLPDNIVAEAALGKLHQYQVGTDHIILGGERMGVYYLEKGASQRPSRIVYDRKYSALSMAQPEEFDWDSILHNALWFHFTGITAALSESTAEICRDAVAVCKKLGIPVSCDLNYRKNLWSREAARETMSGLVRGIDLLIGNEEDAADCLGIYPENTDVSSGRLSYGAYNKLARTIADEFGVGKVAFTLRGSISASDNRWAAMLYENGDSYYSREYLIHMVDRVGGGDSFGAGLIYAQLKGYGGQQAVEFAAAASCLKQTMELDFNLASVSEVERLASGDGSGRVQR